MKNAIVLGQVVHPNILMHGHYPLEEILFVFNICVQISCSLQ